MLEVQQTYRIWMTPRTGSTLLCEGLAATGIAGKPGEFFNTEDLPGTYQTQDYLAFKKKIWELGATPNGVFGIKHGLMRGRYQAWLDQIATMRNLQVGFPENEALIWDDLFPNCRHIFLTRRHKARQAASWWRAIQSEQWHLRKGETLEDHQNFYEEKYDAAALQSLIQNAALRECGTQEFFDRHGINPLTIVYEDMIQDFTGTIKRVLTFLGLSSDGLSEIPKMLQRTATAGTEYWVNRLQKEIRDPEHAIW